MRLLFDQNLPPRLVHALKGEYPHSVHVSEVGLERASDRAVAEYAADRGYAVVTKDADFAELAMVAGSPLNVVWLRLGNCTTADIERVLRDSQESVEQLGDDPVARVLSVG